MKLLIDMNLSPRWVSWLGAYEIDAVHWSSVGEATAHDTAIMRFALNNQRTIPTHDLDFGAILAASGDRGPSVIQLRASDTSPERAGPLVVTALKTLGREIEQGALITVDVLRTRLNILPMWSER